MTTLTDDTLSTLLPIAGWDRKRAFDVEIHGGADPILPTPFRIGETAAASLAAVGLAASDLWKLRTGRGQQIGVNTRHATASLRSSKYMTMDGEPAGAERHPIMGVYPAKGGRWSYLHCNFPNHRDAALRVLGVEEEDGEAVRRAVAKWDALELEGSDHRGKRRRGNGALHGRVVRASTGCRGRFAAFAGDQEDRRQSAGGAARGLQTAIRSESSGPHARAGRPDLRANPRRAWRGRYENHRAASAEHSGPRSMTPDTASSPPTWTCAKRVIWRRCASW